MPARNSLRSAKTALLTLGLTLAASTSQAQAIGTPFGPTTVWEFYGCAVGVSCHRLFVTVQEMPPSTGHPGDRLTPYSAVSHFRLYSAVFAPRTFVQALDVSRASFLYGQLRFERFDQPNIIGQLAASGIAVPSVATFRPLDVPWVQVATRPPVDAVNQNYTHNVVHMDLVGTRVVAEGEETIPPASAVVLTPEPSTWALLASGLLGVLSFKRRRRAS
jgi:hypothetical protein